jgi:Transglycosylase SLT domain
MPLIALTSACIAIAARAYQLPPIYLYAILAAERGHVGQAVENKNGSSDLGPFQINTQWGPALGRYWGVSNAEALARIRDDGCANAIAAAAVLKGFVNESNGDMPTALGFFHSHSINLAQVYREHVLSVARELTIYPTK